MKKKSRTILFIICIFLFVLVAPVAILYSQGYRIDFEENKISQTGGLYFKILPKQAEVYLGCELEKKTDFFFGSALIENLLPGEYQIEVKKEGYHSWQKTLEIKEKQVAEAKNIVLFPEDPGIKVLIREVEDFWFSPDQKKIILLEEDKPSSPTSLSPEESSVKEKSQYGWALKLYETEKNIKSHLIDKTIISLGIVELLDVEFSEDSKEITLKVGVDETIKHYNLNLEQFPIRLIAASPPPPFPLKCVIP